ncbi:hypothetical protein PMAYCL1PPCAC_23661 [Pristionchus mayeri]|uniref:Uncharacterized protein n=1 Tax=Pristionchus mayeri TaxID=1317129 RepID=A0AAN5CYM1_9BILA|nr:hypothetical protein PMAYCL1PPCAC_23661 [Pristionchus mayeri]
MESAENHPPLPHEKSCMTLHSLTTLLMLLLFLPQRIPLFIKSRVKMQLEWLMISCSSGGFLKRIRRKWLSA